MPDNSATINAAAAAVGQATNVIAQGKMNKATRKWNEQQRDMQRKWALEDWDRQNAYNTPAQQMQRLREAGLNPHLIYGGGQPTNTSSNVNTSPGAEWNPKTPDIGAIMTSPANAYMETRSFQTQQAQSEGQLRLLNAQILKTLADTDTKNFDLGMKQALADTQISIAKEILIGKQIQNMTSIDENDRRWLTLDKDLTTAFIQNSKTLSDIDLNEIIKNKGREDITTAQQARRYVETQIENAKKDGTIKDFEISLNKAGFTKTDPAYMRLGKTLWETLIGKKTPQEALGEVNNTFKNSSEKVKSDIMDAIRIFFMKNALPYSDPFK